MFKKSLLYNAIALSVAILIIRLIEVLTQNQGNSEPNRFLELAGDIISFMVNATLALIGATFLGLRTSDIATETEAYVVTYTEDDEFEDKTEK